MFGNWSVVHIHIHPNSRQFNPYYTELVFVHCEEEAQKYPDNIITAWPSEITPGVIEGIHWRLSMDQEELTSRRVFRPLFTFEDFGLSYPLTVENLVDDWEKVMALFFSFTMSEQGLISNSAASRVASEVEADNTADED